MLSFLDKAIDLGERALKRAKTVLVAVGLLLFFFGLLFVITGNKTYLTVCVGVALVSGSFLVAGGLFSLSIKAHAQWSEYTKAKAAVKAEDQVQLTQFHGSIDEEGIGHIHIDASKEEKKDSEFI